MFYIGKLDGSFAMRSIESKFLCMGSQDSKDEFIYDFLLADSTYITLLSRIIERILRNSTSVADDQLDNEGSLLGPDLLRLLRSIPSKEYFESKEGRRLLARFLAGRYIAMRFYEDRYYAMFDNEHLDVINAMPSFMLFKALDDKTVVKLQESLAVGIRDVQISSGNLLQFFANQFRELFPFDLMPIASASFYVLVENKFYGNDAFDSVKVEDYDEFHLFIRHHPTPGESSRSIVRFWRPNPAKKRHYQFTFMSYC